jgi:ferredoxin-thioredoxin reductase catalytic chain
MNAESRKKALRFFFQKVIDPLGYKFSPDSELVEFCLQQEVKLEGKYGIPYCPCKAVTKDRAENMRMVCPCIPFHREHFDAMKRCWCGLFVHKDVMEPGLLKQIPESQIRKGQDVRQSA